MRDGRIVFDRTPAQLTTGVARDIYGADADFSEAATTALSTAAFADGHVITEFRIGVLGGENAQDRMNSYACLQEYASEALGVETKIFTPADYNGVIQGLLGDIDGGVTWAAGLNDNWEDGYDSGALHKAVDAGLIDMNDLVQIWKSAVIPEGPVVLRKSLPADVKMR